MTQLKTGDRVVPVCDNPHQHNLEILNQPHVCSLCGGGNFLNAVSKEPSALTPVKPKWEPGYAEDIEWSDRESRWFKGKYGCPHLDGSHVVFNDKGNMMYAINIRPIAPSTEEELRGLIRAYTGDNTEFIATIIMQWHNRHKEGEGR